MDLVHLSVDVGRGEMSVILQPSRFQPRCGHFLRWWANSHRLAVLAWLSRIDMGCHCNLMSLGTKMFVISVCNFSGLSL